MKATYSILILASLAAAGAGALLLVGGCGRSIDEISPSDVQAIRNSPPVEAAEDDWPWWQGPTFDGKATGPAPPVTWSETENIVWKADVPGRGHASPIVCGDSVFVATADESAETQSLLCFDRHDGSLRWNEVIHDGEFMTKHSDNSHASSTPACDGQRVFTVFPVDDGIWVSAVNVDGEILWQTKAGGFRSKHGYGSSPVLYRSLVIVAGDSTDMPFLAGLDRATGDIVWRVQRDKEHSFATPIVGRVSGRDQLLMSGQDDVVSYDPASGQELWRAGGSTDSTANTMAWSDDMVFATGGSDDNHVVAVRADGSGEVVWRNGTKDYVPSPLVLDDRLLVVSDDGRVFCYEAATGDEVWKRRLRGGFYASPVLAAGHVYLPSKSGPVFVIRAADGDVVAENELSSGGFATTAICGGRIFLRTASRLYCIGDPRE